MNFCNGFSFALYLSKGDQLRENQPNINHLDIRCGGQRFRDTDKEGCEDKLRGEVNGDNRLKEKWFEEVCCVDNG